jgi:hypothetical protein
MGSLTIELDDELIQRAEANSERLGKNLSELISTYLAELGSQTQSAEPKKKSLFGCMRGTAEVLGDIVSPHPEEDWEVLRA